MTGYFLKLMLSSENTDQDKYQKRAQQIISNYRNIKIKKIF